VDEGDARQFEEAAAVRTRALLSLAREHVDRFIAPSRFLAERMTRFGLPAERLSVVPTGVDTERFASVPRKARVPGAPLRVCFLGSLVRLKGAHVLLQAWGNLAPAARAAAELVLHGPSDSEPDYQDELRELARRSGARLAEPLDRGGVARVLAVTDLLVVPSQWYENLPLVVLEAKVTGTPLLVSDLGGLSEAVEEGVHGWRFPLGDVAALSEALARVITDPSRLDALYPEPVRMPSWEELTLEMLRAYEAVRAEKAAR
jgi:glycosyltransferase involved in cell wall biosynthesis